MIEKRSLLEARLKLGSLSVQDYVLQLEVREAMIERLQGRLKLALDGLDHYAEKYPEDKMADITLTKIFEESKQERK